MSAPYVYRAINAITSQLAKKGIAKTQINQWDDYKYRSIDDLLDRLAPLLAAHRLCVLPQVLERSVDDRLDEQGGFLVHVAVRAAFSLVSVDDGTSHEVVSYGEALDRGDKATAKAMSAAYKSAMVQTFCIPVGGADDADRSTHTLRRHNPEPVQGWSQWCLDIQDIIALCESEDAITVIQTGNRDLLTALSREQPEQYRALGEIFADRRNALHTRGSSKAVASPAKRRRKSNELQDA